MSDLVITISTGESVPVIKLRLKKNRPLDSQVRSEDQTEILLPFEIPPQKRDDGETSLAWIIRELTSVTGAWRGRNHFLISLIPRARLTWCLLPSPRENIPRPSRPSRLSIGKRKAASLRFFYRSLRCFQRRIENLYNTVGMYQRMPLYGLDMLTYLRSKGITVSGCCTISIYKFGTTLMKACIDGALVLVGLLQMLNQRVGHGLTRASHTSGRTWDKHVLLYILEKDVF